MQLQTIASPKCVTVTNAKGAECLRLFTSIILLSALAITSSLPSRFVIPDTKPTLLQCFQYRKRYPHKQLLARRVPAKRPSFKRADIDVSYNKTKNLVIAMRPRRAVVIRKMIFYKYNVEIIGIGGSELRSSSMIKRGC